MDIRFFSGSGASWRVLFTLAYKSQDCGRVNVEASQNALKSPEFLALNPRGKVPVLTDGDYSLYESNAIMAFLDKKYPEPGIFGFTPEETGRIWQAILDFDLYVHPGWVDDIIAPIVTGRAESDGDSIRQAILASHAELARLEAAVRGKGWIAGNAFSAADIAIFPLLEALLRMIDKPLIRPLRVNFLPFEARYPALQTWLETIRAMPAYQQSYPDYWRHMDREALAS